MREFDRRISDLEEKAATISGQFKAARIIAQGDEDVTAKIAALKDGGATLVIVRRMMDPIISSDGTVNPNAARRSMAWQ